MDTLTKNMRLRFTINDDLEVLRQVLAENPFEAPCRWRTVTSSIATCTGKAFSRRAIKEHVEYLMKLYVNEDMVKLRKSCTDGEYEEKEGLLQQLVDLKGGFRQQKPSINTSISKTFKVKDEDFSIQDAPLADCSENSGEQEHGCLPEEGEEDMIVENAVIVDASTPASCSSVSSNVEPIAYKIRKKRKSEETGDATFAFIRNRNEKEYMLKEQQLEIEKKRVALEEKRLLLEENKFQLEKEERLARLQMEKEERQAYIKSMEQQQQLMALLLKKI